MTQPHCGRLRIKTIIRLCRLRTEKDRAKPRKAWPVIHTRSFSCDVTTAILVYQDKIIVNKLLFCDVH